MKQIIQDLKKGDTILEEIPVPLVKKGHLLIRTKRTLVSLGTEKMLVEFGKGNLISKAKQQPEKVKQVLEKIKTEGLMPTLEAVFNKLDEPLPLGYCNVGEVIEVGEGITNYKIGDRVASNGHHAEVVCVPQNLCAKVPDTISDEEACFTVIGAIGLQGIRLVNPTLGETVVVVGLGLIGLITAQLLVANGCKVIGFDFDESKINAACKIGIQAYNVANASSVKIVEDETSGIGCDAVIITASTKSNEVISEAAQMCRKKGRIVLVGVIGLDIQRSDFFKKELSFQVSCSYGPGRYDEDYELRGNDYPMGYVRWTEQRNFEAILYAISKGLLQVKELITERVSLKNYLTIYNNLGGKSIASILEYDQLVDVKLKSVKTEHHKLASNKGVVAIIGAGNFTKMTLLPTFKNLKNKVSLKYIASQGGLTSKALAKKYGFEYSTTDYQEIIKDNEVDTVIITTRHDSHSKIAKECILAGKNVFIEKPLAISNDELETFVDAYNNLQNKVSVMVGFNRRFSPFIIKAKELLGATNSPINMVATINAGFIPQDSWVQNMNIGGGRIVGEACHFIDLMIHLTGSEVESVMASGLGTEPFVNTDNAIITLKFKNGSQGVINYFANGSKLYSKERLEVFSQGRILILDNFRKLEGYGFKGFNKYSSTLDKGHKNQFEQLFERIKKGGDPLIPFTEIVNGSKASFAALKSISEGKLIYVE